MQQRSSSLCLSVCFFFFFFIVLQRLMRFMKTSLHLEVQQKAPGAQRPDQVVIQRGKMFICLLAVSPPQQELRRSNCFCTKLMIHTLIALWDNAMETLTFANQNIPSLCFFSQIKWLDLIILLFFFFSSVLTIESSICLWRLDSVRLKSCC